MGRGDAGGGLAIEAPPHHALGRKNVLVRLEPVLGLFVEVYAEALEAHELQRLDEVHAEDGHDVGGHDGGRAIVARLAEDAHLAAAELAVVDNHLTLTRLGGALDGAAVTTHSSGGGGGRRHGLAAVDMQQVGVDLLDSRGECSDELLVAGHVDVVADDAQGLGGAVEGKKQKRKEKAKREGRIEKEE